MIYTHIMVEDVVDASFLNLAGHLHIQTTKEFASVRIGCYSLAHVVCYTEEIISARQDQLKDGIGRMICRSYFLVSISICSSLGRKIISSASRTILCAPVCCAQQRAEMCLSSIRSTEPFGLASTMAFQMR
jgi:hypothetical protein